MRKLIFPVVIIILIAGFGTAWFFLQRRTKNYSENFAFKAIPTKTPLVIEVPEISNFMEKLSEKNPVIAELKTVPELQSFWTDVALFSDLMKEHEPVKKVLEDKSLLIAFNPEGKNNIGCLFAFSLQNRSEKAEMVDFFENMSKKGTGKLNKRLYDDAEIYRYQQGKAIYHFTEDQGIFLFSRHALFVEEAVRQISAGNLLDQEQFRNLYNTVSNSSDFNLFMNHDKIQQLLTKISSPGFRQAVPLFTRFADWTELDINLNKSGFLLGGFSFSSEGNDNYLNIFRKQKAERFSMDEVLSANTSMFIHLNLSDFNAFQNDYNEYLKKDQGSYYRRETKLRELEQYSKKPFLPLFAEIAGDEFALAFGPVTQNEPATNRFFIAGVKGQSIARELLLPMLENYARARNTTLENMQVTYQIRDDQVFHIYEFPFGNFPELLLGKTFSAVESNYLCFYDNDLIFADNLTDLKSYIHDLVLSETLEKDIHFQKFSEQMASRSSFYFFMNFSKAFYLKNYYLHEDVAKAIGENEENFRKFYAMGWQFSASSGEFLNNLYLKYDPEMKEEPQTVWQTKLDSTIAMKPQLVVNHYERENLEILVQDNKNNLYLINKEGVSLWKIKLPGMIRGDVCQIDYYRNGKLQYLFNTRNQLHLIDRNGNPVARFPVQLRSPATNSVAMFDYANNRDYRYFVACENRKVYAYDREGKLVGGWKFDKTDGAVTNPVKHFRLGTRDYLVFADLYKTYILDRQGHTRVQTTDHFEHSGNDLYLVSGATPALATTDTEGRVHLQYFDGRSEVRDLGSFSKDHYFEAEDLDGDGKTDYLFADDRTLSAFTGQGKKIFEREFSFPISGKPNLYEFSANNRKIGIVCHDENRIYLINSNGELYAGFPLQGNTDFSIGFLTSGNSYFNLLVGNEDNSFFNYKME